MTISHSTPTLEFVLDNNGQLYVFNNEQGLQQDNVKALCSVGNSTKKKSEGYIGEKGIGFKSVFVVSREPHFFSNGYQFKFQEAPHPQVKLSYIVPEWVDKKPLLPRQRTSFTCILLPLKQDKIELVQKELESFQPETILFLKKLQTITTNIFNDRLYNLYKRYQGHKTRS